MKFPELFFSTRGGGRDSDHQDSCSSKNLRRLEDPKRSFNMDEVWTGG